MRRPALALLVALAALSAQAAPAAAASDDRRAIYQECQNGAITGTYTQADYADALRHIQTDLDEYTDCRDVIRRAQLGAAGGGGSGGGAGGTGAGGGGGAAPPNPDAGKTAAQLIADATPAERAAVTKAIESDGSAPVVVGGRTVSPDAAGLSPDGAANVVPTPLVVALVLLGLGLAAGGAQTLRSRVVARRTAAA